MKIETVKFSDITPDEYNPRLDLFAEDIEFIRIKNSLEAFGYIEPIVYNRRTGHIVGGHQRVSVLKHLGKTEAEMSIVELDEHEEKLLNLRLNKIKGRWDYDKLEPLLQGFTIDEALLTGFGSEELAVMLAKADEFDMDDFDDDYGYDDEEEGEYADEDDEVPEDFDGASWVIALRFSDPEEARVWCEENGFKGAVKAGASTTVIRMKE